MPRFAANLSMLWQEQDPYARFGLAAEAGFGRVEMLFPHQLETARVREALTDHGLEMVLFDPDPGAWDQGERGTLAIPGREQECRDAIGRAIELAAVLKTPRINCLAGIQPEGVSTERCLDTAVENLALAAPAIERAGLEVLVEPVNSLDTPGYIIDTIEKAASVVERVGHPAVRLQLDQYHVARAGGDPVAALHRHLDRIAHVQIADLPGRGQPGSGSWPIAAFLEELDDAGFQGTVGLEYKPQGTTEESLAWLPPEARR